ncbi:MAG TPA: DUF6531 domain-containing protein, partial [Polyangiaceae bacterium]
MRSAPAPDLLPIPGMNQGTIVAGGGGGSGDGDGNAGEGGDGENGNGGNGNGDANGGGPGTGGCGQGGPGHCTNCGHNVSAGDPVEVLTGKVFTVPRREFFLPGLFNLDFQRSYSAANRGRDIGMGFGWSHTFGWTLEERGDCTVLRTDDGAEIHFARFRQASEERRGPWGLLRDGDRHAVRPGNEFIHYFTPVAPGAKLHRLDFVAYRRRGRIALEYDGTRLARAIDTVGRVIVFEPTPEGRIASIAVTQPGGRTIVFARYAYDPTGNLVAATDADGNTARYAYDAEHRLTRHEFPGGLTFHYHYDRRGRCIETWGEHPGGDPALSPDVPRMLRDGARARGIFHCRFSFGKDYAEVVDSVRVRRIFGGPPGKLRKAIDASGGVTTRTFDERGYITSQTDPTGATWTYANDDLGFPVKEVDPEGGTTTVERDG